MRCTTNTWLESIVNHKRRFNKMLLKIIVHRRQNNNKFIFTVCTSGKFLSDSISSMNRCPNFTGQQISVNSDCFYKIITYMDYKQYMFTLTWKPRKSKLHIVSRTMKVFYQPFLTTFLVMISKLLFNFRIVIEEKIKVSLSIKSKRFTSSGNDIMNLTTHKTITIICWINTKLNLTKSKYFWF